MSADALEFFRKCFPLLAHGNRPYLWQTAVFERLVIDDWPDSVATAHLGRQPPCRGRPSYR